jgi:hypothetical protein
MSKHLEGKLAEEKKDKWLNYLALSSVILAVCATLSTFRGGSYSTRTVLSQTKASDQWAFYQAKSVKGNLYEIQKEEHEVERAMLGNKISPEAAKEFQLKDEEYTQRIDRYNTEKAQIEKDAKNFEDIRDHSLEHSQAFGMAVIFLQIAILLSSIAALMKKKPVWLIGLISGAFGILYFLNGFLLFM